MQVHLKIRTTKNGYKFARCGMCREKKVFRSFKAAELYAKEQGASCWKATRVR
jgi:hypothetical protein